MSSFEASTPFGYPWYLLGLHVSFAGAAVAATMGKISCIFDGLEGQHCWQPLAVDFVCMCRLRDDMISSLLLSQQYVRNAKAVCAGVLLCRAILQEVHVVPYNAGCA